MKVLVTGATGFVGANVARSLEAFGHSVRALVRPGSSTLNLKDTGFETVPGDIRDRESVVRGLRGCDAVVHCAAAYTFWARDPGVIYDVNVSGTRVVLEEALKAGVGRCVYTSTVSTVHIPKGGLGTEEVSASPGELVGHYKRSKHQAEQEALDLAGRGLPVVVVNPTTPVGPWDVKPTPTGRIVLDFIRGRVPAYVDTGMNVVDVEDVAAGHVLALEKGIPGERYLLGNRNMTLAQVFGVLEGLTGRRAPRLKLPTWMAIAAGYVDQVVEGMVLRREPAIPVEGLKVSRKPMYVDCRKAVETLGVPQSPVEGALEKAVRWFREHGYD
ncbi:MAG: NAD-dependent epimerase/dehydratase family protein [Dehalococcoidia bacterium]|nr:NAD-dependent epimerase/dehydratase family protein [Dehalococcoidia bacterium]